VAEDAHGRPLKTATAIEASKQATVTGTVTAYYTTLPRQTAADYVSGRATMS